MESSPLQEQDEPSRNHPLSGLWHGAAYYPELWPGLDIREELERIKAAGLQVVRLGEFAWSRMEPEQDSFDLGFFVKVMDCIEESGLKAIFGTPTTTPPVWITHGHPERCLHDVEGRPMSHGGRQHLAIDEPFVRARCAKVVEAVAKALGDHPALIAWQIDNEFKCDVDGDYGPSAWNQWKVWLEERYGSVRGLNEAWGTGVWSQEYQSFDQVPLPVKCAGMHNASLMLAFKRFTRDRIADFAAEQIHIVRKYSSKPITHNMGMLFQSDPVRIARNLDFVSFDLYVDSDNYSEAILNYDFWRNLGKTRSFWLMETSSGHNGNLEGFHKPHSPLFVRAQAVAAYVLGARGFAYWLWRQQRSGAELTHGCLMQSWGSPSMGMQAAQKVEAARQVLEPVLEGKSLELGEVAIIWSDTGRTMLQVEPHKDMDYPRLIGKWSECIRDLGMHMDVIPEGKELAGCKVILTPYIPALDMALLERLKAFVEQGGIWISGPITGGRTTEHTVHIDAGLGELEEFAGIRTLHSYPLFDSGTYGNVFGQKVELGGWSYLFEPTGATLLAKTEGGPTPDLGFISERSVGKGKVVVLGAELVGDNSKVAIQALIANYAAEAEVRHWYDVSKGSIVAPWSGEDGNILICINLDGKGGQVSFESPVVCVLTGRRYQAGPIEVQPYAYLILRYA